VTRETQAGPLVNWAGNVSFRAGELHRPESVAELRRLVARSERIRALGTAHSFSRVADTIGDLVSVAGLPPRVEVSTDRAAVTVSAGLRYSDLAPRLHAAGLALGNLASLPDISVAGAVATGTHGSGDGNVSLAAAVSALDLVTAGGDLISVRRHDDPDRFPGLVVALGACGVVTALTLDVVPAFVVRQWVYENIPFTEVAAHFDEITGSAYSVSMFTDWRAQRMTQTWLKRAGDEENVPPASWLGGRLARADLNPVIGMPAANCTPQLGLPGPWHERLPHFRAGRNPSAGAELQSEFLIGREHGADALAALDAIRSELALVTRVCEIRTVAADDLWLSPSYQRATAAIHFTWVPDGRAVAPALASAEAALAPFAPRGHWAKLTALPSFAVAGCYPRIEDFRRLAAELDPDGKFGNEMVDAWIRPAG
jgi:alditol oxidase